MRVLAALLVLLLGLAVQAGAAGVAQVTLGAGDGLGERMFSRPLRRRLYESGARPQPRVEPLDLNAWLREWRGSQAESPRPESEATRLPE